MQWCGVEKYPMMRNVNQVCGGNIRGVVVVVCGWSGCERAQEIRSRLRRLIRWVRGMILSDCWSASGQMDGESMIEFGNRLLWWGLGTRFRTAMVFFQSLYFATLASRISENTSLQFPTSARSHSLRFFSTPKTLRWHFDSKFSLSMGMSSGFSYIAWYISSWKDHFNLWSLVSCLFNGFSFAFVSGWLLDKMFWVQSMNGGGSNVLNTKSLV